jgi:hypothetical protein
MLRVLQAIKGLSLIFNFPFQDYFLGTTGIGVIVPGLPPALHLPAAEFPCLQLPPAASPPLWHLLPAAVPGLHLEADAAVPALHCAPPGLPPGLHFIAAISVCA